jgi:hypothetical protein
MVVVVGVSISFLMVLKHRPMSFFDELLTAHISLNVRGTDSLLQAKFSNNHSSKYPFLDNLNMIYVKDQPMYMQAAMMASLLRPLMILFLCTVP